jgi:hypothetical protein
MLLISGPPFIATAYRRRGMRSPNTEWTGLPNIGQNNHLPRTLRKHSAPRSVHHRLLTINPARPRIGKSATTPLVLENDRDRGEAIADVAPGATAGAADLYRDLTAETPTRRNRGGERETREQYRTSTVLPRTSRRTTFSSPLAALTRSTGTGPCVGTAPLPSSPAADDMSGHGAAASE